MQKLCDYKSYAQKNGIDEDLLWENWEQFRIDHDMVIANWLADSTKLIEGNEGNTFDVVIGEYKPVFAYYIVDSHTIRDIKDNNIDIPFYENEEVKLYAISIPFRGIPWSEVKLMYLCEQEPESDTRTCQK